MKQKILKLWRWILSLFTKKRAIETIPFDQLELGQLYLRPSDWKMVSKKREWKRQILAKARAGVEKDGGTFLHINWNKRKIHYIDKAGRRMLG